MVHPFKITTYDVQSDGGLASVAEYAASNVTTAIARAGELSVGVAGVAVVAIFEDGSTETLVRYGQTPVFELISPEAN
jgi:hypothetical protein